MFHPTDTAAALIDGPNFYATARALGIDVDYKRLMGLLSQTGRLLRASYFTPISTAEGEHVALRPLVDWLDYNGWNVIAKPAREFTDDEGRRRFRGNTDVDLALTAVNLAPRITHMALFTGNRDFAPLVQDLQSKGVRVTVVSSMKTKPSPFAADELRRAADTFLDLEDLRPLISRPERASAAA
ncbi:NYN domain-containing protein [Pseudooceanicola sp. CBS1P-1]|uniref:NYN domain-containing protein n=1 Tax=Pseudooceanicola albus TaxID=2692189 RepID=A0A6L7FY65_9RHOB|nr:MULTISPECIES: NYN domain-containing protein [Pseudooceanicola]MBT9383305.1 NYN domain-containing protein [Pseudooceanicola endophyticus]MXN16372.1 NYN domain-containing protein [Pseudooceanicola albus]